MDRDLPDSVRASLNAEQTDDALLTFAEITHPLLSGPLRVVADVVPYVWQSVTWHPVLFQFDALTDTDRPTEARVTLPAIDQTIANALIALPDRARISVWVLTSADFDLTADPRTAIGTPVPLMELLNFDLVDINGNVVSASGRLLLRDYTQEPWPGIRATESRCPGLFA
jgi:hypothetical protein